MSKVILRTKKGRRKLSVRKNIFGDENRPRLSIFRSNKYIYGQIIDDEKGVTLVDVQKEAKDLHKGKNKVDAAELVGKELAKKAMEKKIEKVVFDRNGYKYHGRVKSFADGAREGGLNF